MTDEAAAVGHYQSDDTVIIHHASDLAVQLVIGTEANLGQAATSGLDQLIGIDTDAQLVPKGKSSWEAPRQHKTFHSPAGTGSLRSTGPFIVTVRTSIPDPLRRRRGGEWGSMMQRTVR